MKPGDLCKFVGTTGWGTLCIVVDVDVWDESSAGQVRVLSDNGKVGCLAHAFLEVMTDYQIQLHRTGSQCVSHPPFPPRGLFSADRGHNESR